MANSKSVQSIIRHKRYVLQARREVEVLKEKDQEMVKVDKLNSKILAMEEIIIDLLSKSATVSDETITKLGSVGIRKFQEVDIVRNEETIGLQRENSTTSVENEVSGDEDNHMDSSDVLGDTLQDEVQIKEEIKDLDCIERPEDKSKSENNSSVIAVVLEESTLNKTSIQTTPELDNYKCTLCDLSCKRMSNLKRHMAVKHDGRSAEPNRNSAKTPKPMPSASKESSKEEHVVTTKSGRRCKKKKLFDFEEGVYIKDEISGVNENDYQPAQKKRNTKTAKVKRTEKETPKIVWVVYRGDGKFEVPKAVTISDKDKDVSISKQTKTIAEGECIDGDQDYETIEVAGASRFKCSKSCSRSFLSLSELHEHRKVDHPKSRRWHCHICGQYFPNFGEKAEHIKSCEVEERPCICDICGKVKNTMKELKLHIIAHKRVEKDRERRKANGSVEERKMKVNRWTKRPCNVCGKQFNTAGMKKHMASHNRPVLCDSCGRDFPSQDSLATHKLRDHEDMSQAKFKCDVCGMVFTTLNMCKSHMSVHKEVRDVTCEFCNKTFPCERYLWTHRKVKHLEKKHTCQLCDKKFGLKTQLKIHIDTVHLKIRKYRCKKCSMQFSDHSTFSKHKNTHHAGEVAFQCLLCMKGFQRRYRYRSHLHQAHGVETSIQDDGQMIIHGQENLMSKLEIENVDVTDITETYEQVV